MIVLDTNVVSELMRVQTHANVRAWAQRHPVSSLYLCAPSVMEIVFGAEKICLREGNDRLLARFNLLVEEVFRERVIAFEESDARTAGRLRATREAAGRPILPGDQMIAAICLTHGATLATRNVRDFEGIDLCVVNPFEA